ncbi:MAG: YebC/PmpR family DNA-binding transcriptional regulator [Nitrospirae bacterium]|nr:YebC/PmpR family DNA-binding transcriptional regulator [Nitrospirota bacterium]
MSGHSKWSQIKHKKAATDSKKGKAFSKLSREISVAARIGGGNAEMNARLRLAMEKAREVNMPSDNIKRAIQKGTGELPGSQYEEIRYEGYGPGGTALIIDATTDNKTRTVSEIRHILSKQGGNMGETGSVAWVFDKKGYILVDKKSIDEDALMSVALDAGAEDIRNDPEEDNYEIITIPEDFKNVKESLEKQGIKFNFGEITMLPKSHVKLQAKEAEQMLRLMDALEDQDDVQNVYANFDIPDEIMAKVK